ncbi:DUF3068 domain-containing protein [Microbispora sp. ATCC PTA-5024]|uniref:DUF3068 domain-containing protein n=1 Tax=Microbispora sp. ATCC PTA-5024 TaxID=316330 RepID=UPI0003DD1F7A|nr:DUF3068 domain-containing protein [Microbispora sp. ATCC PTA-5024]ETK33622.1 hypothetical protein MPTA5024_23585 [Microbispora sp. ATCC PTA-5024]
MIDALIRLPKTVLIAGAAFLVTVAALFRFYVYPHTLVLPLEQTRVYRMASPSATYLDSATFQLRTGVPVENTVSLYGDPSAGDDRTAVWVEFSSLETGDGQRLDYHERRTAFDRRTGEAVNCCGEYVDDDTGVSQTGLAFRLPFHAEPRTYEMFDPVLKRQAPLRFERAETVEGVPVYRYTYSAGPVKVEDLPDQVPGASVGLPSWRRISVSRYTEITRTLWVEPESGLTVKAEERRRDTLRTPDQVERQTSFQADLVMNEGDVQARAAEAARFRQWIVLVRDVVPVGFLVLGGVLLAMYAWQRAARLARRLSAPQDEQQVPGHDLANAG